MTDFTDGLAQLRRRIEAALAADDADLDAAGMLRGLQSAYAQLQDADAQVQGQAEKIAALLEGHDVLRAQHEWMFAGLPLPLMTTDGDGVIRSANAAVAQLVGTARGRMVGRSAFPFVAAADRPALRAALETLGRREETHRRVVTVLQREADDLAVDVTLTVLPGWPRAVTWMLTPTGEDVRLPDPLLSIPTLLARLAALPMTLKDVGEALQHSARLIGDGLQPRRGISLTLGSPLRPNRVASSAAAAQDLDGAQIAAHEGPCVTAYETATTVETDNLSADERWPRLAESLADDGADDVAVVAAPLMLGGRSVGTLTVYCEPSRLDPGLVETCGLLATTVGAVIYELGVKAELLDTARGLEQAMESRAGIEQAKGIIMATKGCTADEAFHYLVELSSTNHLKLRDVAQRITEETASS